MGILFLKISRAELFSVYKSKKYILSDNRYIKSYLENFGNSKKFKQIVKLNVFFNRNIDKAIKYSCDKIFKKKEKFWVFILELVICG